VETTKKNHTIIPTIFPGSVGLSNPLSDKKIHHQQQITETEIKRKIFNDNLTKRPARPHVAIIENTLIQSSIDPGVTKTTTAEIVRNASLE
jgi:hypothetical protein